jgi:hypothetical protein
MVRFGQLAAVVLGVLGVLVPSLAAAEMYCWVDASGSVTYSNLPPPKEARLLEIIPEEPPLEPARVAQAKALADEARQSQMQALNDRIRQLEQQVELTQRQPPPAVPYPVASGPASTCDSEFFDCGGWAGPYYTVGYLAPGSFRHRPFGHHHGDHGAPHAPFAGAGPGRTGGSFLSGGSVHGGGPVHGSGSVHSGGSSHSGGAGYMSGASFHR